MDVLMNCCCGLDIHKELIEACIIKGWLEDPDIYRERFGTSRRELARLADWLETRECHHVAMESTGIYWRKAYETLEDRAGIDCLMVVNAHHMRNLPGRKRILRRPPTLLPGPGLCRVTMRARAR